MVTSLRSGRKGFSSSNFPRDFPVVQSVLSGCHEMPQIHCVLVVLSVGKKTWKFEIYLPQILYNHNIQSVNYSVIFSFILIQLPSLETTFRINRCGCNGVRIY